MVVSSTSMNGASEIIAATIQGLYGPAGERGSAGLATPLISGW
jgi:hypothetical protein